MPKVKRYFREFKFLPDIECYDYQPWGHKIKCYEVPHINYIANYLENKGWEIIDYKEIPSGLSDTHGIPTCVKNGIVIRAISYTKPTYNEPYIYRMSDEVIEEIKRGN